MKTLSACLFFVFGLTDHLLYTVANLILKMDIESTENNRIKNFRLGLNESSLFIEKNETVQRWNG
jgi:hypothetical protein